MTSRLTDSPTPLSQGNALSAVDLATSGSFERDFTLRSDEPFAAPEPTREAYNDWSNLSMEEMPAQQAEVEESPYNNRIIAVSCRLFLKVKKLPDGTWDIKEAQFELLHTALTHLYGSVKSQETPYFHIGWIDTQVDPEDRHELSSILMNRYKCVPIYLEADEAEGYYHGFCKGVLWPLLHYSLRTKNFVNKFKHFPMYQKINKRFADAVLRIYRKNDVVWIHDYHLFLTPQYIRDVIPTAIIGYFMHSPFPTVELFRQLPVREELLKGMLGSDVIGFNAYSYCNHHRDACEVLISVDTESKGLLADDGRFVRTHITPAGIDYNRLKELITSENVRKSVLSRRSDPSFEGLKIVVGRSRKLDDAQGTLLRLQAFEEFLEKNQHRRGKVVLLEVVDQMAVTTDSDLQALVQETVGNINGRFGELGNPPPVHLVQPKSSNVFSMEESCELYMLAHVLMVTPVRDGLSLSSHEAVICQADFELPGVSWKGNNAPLILSEFAGAATALGGSLIVNPHDVSSVSQTIETALNMKESEREQAHSHNLKYVQRNTTHFWAENCLRELVQTSSETVMESLTSDLKNEHTLSLVREDYLSSQHRLLLIDWDGTLVSSLAAQQSRDVVIPENVEILLNRLCSDPCNLVYIMTGRRTEEVAPFMKHINNIGLICEHGNYIKPCGEEEFVTLSDQTAWINQIRDMVQDYQDRTPGSELKVKNASMTWHWREADHNFACWMEKDLVLQLHQRMTSLPFTLFSGRRSVEIICRGASKHNAVHWLLENRHHDLEFVLAIGDDRCDESLFEYLHHKTDEYVSSFF